VRRILGKELLGMTPEKIIDNQLGAYNNHDLEAYLNCFSSDIEVRSFPSGKLMADRTGPAFRARFQKMFEDTPDVQATLVSRVVHGRFVVDSEVIRSTPEAEPRSVTAIYEVGEEQILRMWFVD
jgi:hypothetical protein